jgi:predicted O-methyltransferase YrrM
MFLQFYESSEASFSGSVQPAELGFLEELVTHSNSFSGEIIEVGTLFGFTTQHIAKWKRSDKTLTTIDNFSWNPIGMPDSAHRGFTTRSLSYLTEKANVKIFAGTSMNYYSRFVGERPAMIFIDAGHTYEEVMVDIRWSVKMKIPIISGHDYSDSHPGVKQAVDEVFGVDKKVVGSIWAHMV